MKLRFLGTGTSTGVPEIACTCRVCTSGDVRDKRLRASVLLETGGKRILIDCGPDFRRQMLSAMHQEIFTTLDAVLLTHEHYDHVGGLDDLRAFSHKQDVDVYAEPYVADAIISRIPYVFQENKYPGVPNINMHKIALAPFSVKGIEIIPIRLMHGKLPILGYRIGRLAYLTDLKTIPEEEYDKLTGLDVLVVNALREREHLSHQTVTDALNQIRRINPRKAYLTHMSHSFGLHEEMSRELPPEVFVSYDGLEIKILK